MAKKNSDSLRQYFSDEPVDRKKMQEDFDRDHKQYMLENKYQPFKYSSGTVNANAGRIKGGPVGKESWTGGTASSGGKFTASEHLAFKKMQHDEAKRGAVYRRSSTRNLKD